VSTFAADTSLVLTRELRPVVRDPFSVIFAMVQPLVFLALFGPLLDQVSGLGTASSLQWFVPGIVVMSALFAASTTGANLQQDIKTGAHERLLVTPLDRSALLVGRAFKEVVPVLLQTAIIVAVTIPFGFRFEPLGAVAGLLIVAAFAVGLGALSHSLALAAKDNDWVFWGVQQTLLFPLLLLSGMLLPIEGAPGWMQALSQANPLTHVVDAERALFDGRVAEASVGWGVLSALVVLAVGLWVGVRATKASAA
jgi:ABC-2 type transport system permease protein